MSEPDYLADADRLGVNVSALRFAYLGAVPGLDGRVVGESWSGWLARVEPELKALSENEKAAQK